MKEQRINSGSTPATPDTTASQTTGVHAATRALSSPTSAGPGVQAARIASDPLLSLMPTMLGVESIRLRTVSNSIAW